MAIPLLFAILFVGPIPHLSWAPGEPQVQTGFLIERADASTCDFQEVGRVDAQTVTFDDVSASLGIPIVYQVRAFNDIGVSPHSNVAAATPTSGTPSDVTQTFTFLGVGAIYTVTAGPYACQRQVGGTARVLIQRNNINVVPPKALANPAKGVPFQLRCQVTASAVNLYIDGVLRLTGPAL